MAIGPKDIPDFSGKQTQATIEAIIEKWKPLLGLHNWKIRVVWNKPIRAKHNAEIYVSDKLRSAAMAIHPSYVQWSDYWAETTIIHELLHCLHKPVDTVWDKATTNTLHPEFVNVMEDNYITEMERFIDQLSCRLYDLYKGV